MVVMMGKKKVERKDYERVAQMVAVMDDEKVASTVGQWVESLVALMAEMMAAVMVDSTAV